MGLAFVVGLLWSAGTSTTWAAPIGGTVVVKRKITKPKVTAVASAYDRGVAVDLAAGPASIESEFERVVVYLEGALPRPEPAVATMRQKNRRFLPEVLAVAAGSQVAFPNQDPIFHNVFSLSKPMSFDLGNYPKDQSRTVTFAKPGIVFVNCHLHTNMTAAIVVTPNQAFARPDAHDRFQLPEVPAGTYTVVAWHKTAGHFRQNVTVSETGVPDVRFLIPVDDAQQAASSR